MKNFQLGGHEGTRTPNFFLVREAVYQLTYMPDISIVKLESAVSTLSAANFTPKKHFAICQADCRRL